MLLQKEMEQSSNPWKKKEPEEVWHAARGDSKTGKQISCPFSGIMKE